MMNKHQNAVSEMVVTLLNNAESRPLTAKETQALRESFLDLEDRVDYLLRVKPFQHPNYSGEGFVCPVCQTSDDKPVVLVPIAGTVSNGLVECKQVHETCNAFVAQIAGADWQIHP